jgi:protein pelota
LSQKERFIKLLPETLDDLWHLEQVIETDDIVSGITDRKIKGKDDNQKSQRVTLFVAIKVETVVFHEYSSVLKLNGTVTYSKPEELAPLHSHQSIDFEPGSEIKIEKSEWKNWQIDRLKKAEKASGENATLLIVLDDEQATFGILKHFDLMPAGNITTKRSGKRFTEKDDSKPKYFAEIVQKAAELKPKQAVIAGPGFTKEEFQKYLKEKSIKIAAQTFFETTNQTGPTGLAELVKNGSLDKLLAQNQMIADTKHVERFLAELGKQSGLAEYGFDTVKKAVLAGAVDTLVIVDEFLLQDKAAQALLRAAEDTGAKTHILSRKTDAGKKIAGFGGAVAILRYRQR